MAVNATRVASTAASRSASAPKTHPESTPEAIQAHGPDKIIAGNSGRGLQSVNRLIQVCYLPGMLESREQSPSQVLQAGCPARAVTAGSHGVPGGLDRRLQIC